MYDRAPARGTPGRAARRAAAERREGAPATGLTPELADEVSRWHDCQRCKPRRPADLDPEPLRDPPRAARRRARAGVRARRARAATRCCSCTAGRRRSGSGGATSSRSPQAGFEVIVPDLRGFGDSGLAPDGFYDLAAHARDLHALVHDVLGHERCAAAGGDLGGGGDPGPRACASRASSSASACSTRSCRCCRTQYEAAGHPTGIPREVRQAADYFLRQGRDADELAAELDTPEKRRRYIAQFYGSRFWAAPGSFTREDGRLHDRAVRRRRQAARRASASTSRRSARRAALRAAAVLRDEPGADAGPLRARGPRHPARLPRALRGRLHRAHRARSSCRGPATSCSGSARTC